MKHQTLQTLGLALVTVVSFSACDGLGKLVKNADKITYKVTPDPLEEHGDSVVVSVSGTYPAKIFPKKAIVTTVPTIKFNGGEKELKPVVLIGEKVKNATGQTIKNAEGGSFNYTSEKVAYTPEMRKATLEVKVTGQVKKKSKDLPAKKIADGTIATPMLVKNDEKPLMAKDNFVKTIPRSHTGNIFFVIDQSQVRGAEMNGADMKAFKEFVATGLTKGYSFKNINVSAYASPDGELSRNSNLAESRAKETEKALIALFKDKKLMLEAASNDAFYNKVTTAEDWDGFKKAMEASSIADKDLILRVLSMYSDGETREKEIKNLAKTYTEVADKILPQLRRAVITLNAEEKSRTDEEIKALAAGSGEGLSVEEFLYAATLTNDLNAKLDIYKKAEGKYSSDWRTANNVGYIYILLNKPTEAETFLKKAEALTSNPMVKNNLGIVARWKGDRKKAMELYKEATAAGAEVSYNMGIIEIQNGNYATAVSDFGTYNTFNAALGKLLNKNFDGALTTLDAAGAEKETALAYYLRAIAGAHLGKADIVTNNIKTAIQKDGSLKQMAADDAEFLKYKDAIGQ